jgi:hypothetical protein
VPVAVAHRDDLPGVFVPLDPLHRAANEDLRPALDRVDRVLDAEAGPVDPPFVEAQTADEIAVEPGLELPELVRRKARVRLAPLERLVLVVGLEEGVHEREEHPALTRPLDRHQERDAEEHVRRDRLDVARVAARGLGDLGVVGQVAGAAVDHPARIAAGAESKIVALEQRDTEAAHRGVASDADAVDTAADHHNVNVDIGPAGWPQCRRRGPGSWSPGGRCEENRHSRAIACRSAA